MKLWYAVVYDCEDSDLGSGSFDVEASKAHARKLREEGYLDAHIVVVGEDDEIVEVIEDVD